MTKNTKQLVLIGAALLLLGGGTYLATPKTTPKDLGDAKENLQTYENQKFGFSLEYPKNWQRAECDNGEYGLIMSFGDSKQLLVCNSDAVPEGYLNLSVSPLIINGETIDINERIEGAVFGLDKSSMHEIMVNGEKALQVEGLAKQFEEGMGPEVGSKIINIFLKHKDTYFNFFYLGKKGEDRSAEFNATLNTLRFL